MSAASALSGRIAAGLRALAADRTGTPVVEFALVLPVLLTAYLGSFVVLDAISCSRKVSIAANQVTDITSRYMSVTTGDLDTIMAATTQIMQPYNASNAMVRLSQVQVCASGYKGKSGIVARVVWSQARNGTARTVDTTSGGTQPVSSPQQVPDAALITLPANMLTSTSPLIPASGCATGGYFILGEMDYTYTPALKMFAVGSTSSFTFTESSYMSPRGTTSIGLVTGT